MSVHLLTAVLGCGSLDGLYGLGMQLVQVCLDLPAAPAAQSLQALVASWHCSGTEQPSVTSVAWLNWLDPTAQLSRVAQQQAAVCVCAGPYLMQSEDT